MAYLKLMETHDGKPDTFDVRTGVGYVDINGPYYEDGEMVIGIPRAIHCTRAELQIIKEYADTLGNHEYSDYLGFRFPDPSASTYRGCLELLEAHPKYKTVGDYLLHLARVDDPERSSGLEKLLLRPANQTKLLKKK